MGAGERTEEAQRERKDFSHARHVGIDESVDHVELSLRTGCQQLEQRRFGAVACDAPERPSRGA